MDEDSEDLTLARPSSMADRPFEPYVHDPQNNEILAGLLDRSYTTSTHRWNIVDDIRKGALEVGLDPSSPQIRELVLIAAYDLRLSASGESPGCTLVPQSGLGADAYPQSVSTVDSDVVTLWRNLADRVQHPGAKARLNDLLFLRRDGNAYTRATAAIDAYLADVAAKTDMELNHTAALVRAWDLARSVGDQAREVIARDAMTREATDALQDDPKGAGIVLPLLGALATMPKKPKGSRASSSSAGDDACIDMLLDEAWRAYREGWLVSELARHMRSRAQTPAEIEAINRREVQAYIDEAMTRPGLVRSSILETAVAIARAHGLTDLVERATALLQAIPKSDLGLVTMSTSVSIPTDYIERWLSPFTRYPDWRFGVEYFLSTDCPSGQLAALKKQAKHIAQVAVFVSAVTVKKLNADGLPRWTAATDEERQEDQLAQVASISATNQGRHLAMGLMRMAERYGTPKESDLMTVLSRAGSADPNIAASAARAFIHFWNQDYEACVHVAVPKIEASARALLRELDEGIYRTQAAATPGGYPGLYVLLQKLDERALDESWAYFLRWLLASPAGPNLRNEIAHGFVTRISPAYAALILRALTLLSTVVLPQPVEWVGESEGLHPLMTNVFDPPAPRRREDLLRLLGHPVPNAVPRPSRTGPAGRLARGGASAARLAAVALAVLSRRLEGDV